MRRANERRGVPARDYPHRSPPYATDSRRRTRSSQAAVRASHSPLPREVFKLVLSFWRSKRDDFWYDEYTFLSRMFGLPY